MQWCAVALTCLIVGVVAGCGGSDDHGVLRTQSHGSGGATGDGAVETAASGGAPGDTGGASGSGGLGTQPGGSPNTGGVSGTGVAVPCASDKACTPLGKLCNVTAGTCVDCLRDVDCQSGLSCRNGACVRIYSCGNSKDCFGVPDGRAICDSTIGECVQCVTAGDCDPANDCIADTCIPYIPCQNSFPCGVSKVCDTGLGRCVDCTADADCGAGQVCRNRFCEAASCVPGECAGRCGIVQDGCGGALDCGVCGAGNHCQNGVMDADETGADCGGTACAACSACLTQSACAGHCGPLPDGCGKSLDCGPCSTAGAWAPCTVDADCTGGRTCTKSIQDSLLGVPGRMGSCVLSCNVGSSAGCDPAPAGSEPSGCLSGICSLPCTQGKCAAGFDCVPTLFAALCLRP